MAAAGARISGSIGAGVLPLDVDDICCSMTGAIF